MNLIIESSISVAASSSGWLGFDWDGTLVHYPPGKTDGPVGKFMEGSQTVELLRRLLANGVDVRIVTARVGPGTSEVDIAEVTKDIQAECLLYLGKKLPVTASKDYRMIAILDDRAVQVEFNTGKILGNPEKISGWPLTAKSK